MHLASTRSLLLTTAALLACNGEDVTAPRTGSLAVSTVTAGAEPATDGYTLLIDGTEHGPIGAAAIVTLSDITPGPHTLGLSNVAGNCVIQGDNPRGVTVVAGEITTIAFDITCATTAEPTGKPPLSSASRLRTPVSIRVMSLFFMRVLSWALLPATGRAGPA